jgi:hypothetical protein
MGTSPLVNHGWGVGAPRIGTWDHMVVSPREVNRIETPRSPGDLAESSCLGLLRANKEPRLKWPRSWFLVAGVDSPAQAAGQGTTVLQATNPAFFGSKRNCRSTRSATLILPWSAPAHRTEARQVMSLAPGAGASATTYMFPRLPVVARCSHARMTSMARSNHTKVDRGHDVNAEFESRADSVVTTAMRHSRHSRSSCHNRERL